MIEKTGVTGGFIEYRREPEFSTLLYDFDIDSARLKQRHHEYIEKVLAPAIIRKGMLVNWKLTVTGHTSASGSRQHNKTLSKRRAQAVANLIRLHTPLRTVRIEVIGAGEDFAKEREGFLDRSVHIVGGRPAARSPSRTRPARRTSPCRRRSARRSSSTFVSCGSGRWACSSSARSTWTSRSPTDSSCGRTATGSRARS